MSYHLLVNPGTPQAWKIQLRPGTNRVGREEANDFTVNHESVSGAHCEFTVSDAGIFVKDLGSTNGTFVNRVSVTEIQLQPGQHVQVGQVDMTLETDAADPITTPPPPMAIPIPVPLPGGVRPPPAGSSSFGVRISKGPPEPEIEEASNTPPPMAPPAVDGGNAVCKSHPKTPARFLCGRCQKYFCDLCVNTRGMGKYCRTCGQACTPLRVQAFRPVAAKSFYARLPGAIVYALGDKSASMSIPRILGVGVGLVLSFFALLFLLFSMGLYLNEPGVPHRRLNCAVAALPLLITVGVVYACFSSEETSYGRALLYTILAELCVCVVLALFLWWLAWSLQRSSPKGAPANRPQALRSTRRNNSIITFAFHARGPAVAELGRSARR